MGVISGSAMAVKGQASAREWRIQYTGHLRGWTSSGLTHGTARSTGVKDWVGWYRGFGHTPAVFPGESYEFMATIDGADPSLGATGTAFCTDIIVRASHELGGPIEYMVRFGGDGAITVGSCGEVVADAVAPNPGEALDIKIEIGNSFVEESDVRDIMMHISCAVKPYCSSATAGVMKRVGGRLDSLIEYHTYEDAPSDYKAPGSTNTGLKFFVTATTFWEFLNVQMDDLEDYGTDLGAEGQLSDPPGGLCRWRMDGHKAGAAVGSIKNPATTNVWPGT